MFATKLPPFGKYWGSTPNKCWDDRPNGFFSEHMQGDTFAYLFNTFTMLAAYWEASFKTLYFLQRTALNFKKTKQ